MSDFAISQQHYLFSVQAFAHAVLARGGSEYSYALRDRNFDEIVADLTSARSELGVICRTSFSRPTIDAVLEDNDLAFVPLALSAPRVALPAASHPLVHAKKLALEDLVDYPYVYFEQEPNAPVAFYEEALSDYPRARRIACTDRASLSELIAATNGYTITSGILVGITDGSLLETVPLETDVRLELGYVHRKGEELSEAGAQFVEILGRSLERYARL